MERGSEGVSVCERERQRGRERSERERERGEDGKASETCKREMTVK